jgi:DNA-directed RNA polymerase specialized sigma24 family protein
MSWRHHGEARGLRQERSAQAGGRSPAPDDPLSSRDDAALEQDPHPLRRTHLPAALVLPALLSPPGGPRPGRFELSRSATLLGGSDLALDEALTALAAVDRAAADLVHLRYFGGLSISDAAQVLGVSPADGRPAVDLRPGLAPGQGQGPRLE